MIERIELTPGFFVQRETADPQEVVLTPAQEKKIEEIAADVPLTEEELHNKIARMASDFNDLSGSIGAMEKAMKFKEFAKYDIQRLKNKKAELEVVRTKIVQTREILAGLTAEREAEYAKRQEEKRLLKQKKSKEQALRQATRITNENAAKTSKGKKKS